MSPQDTKQQWIEKLSPGQVSELFNYMPDTLYFVKDHELRLMAGNQTFVERCGFQSEEEMIGKAAREIFPIEMAEKYMNDDRKVISSRKPLIEIVDDIVIRVIVIDLARFQFWLAPGHLRCRFSDFS